MALFEYMQQTQRLINDMGQRSIDPADLTDYINRARREAANRSQSVRVLTPISGSIVSATVTAAGANYTNPTVTITAPDFPSGMGAFPRGLQATAIANTNAGGISTVDIQIGGSGYFQPQATISDPTGSGAAVSLTTSLLNTVNINQEVYPFRNVDLSPYPGVGAIIAVKSVSIIYSNLRFSLPIYSFSTYQAWIRKYPQQYSYVPSIGAQFGEGDAGSFFLYPLPSQRYQMEWDCYCEPADLTSDEDAEPLPRPWRDGVPFLAAYYAYMQLQNLNSALFYRQQFDDWMTCYSGYARPGRATNPYGRW